MEYKLIADAPVLLPNPDHQNFTASSEVIPQGYVTEGKPKMITGLRKGQPFVYRLFITKDNKLIYLNKVKPMETTEVTLGADSQQSPTIIDIPAKAVISAHTVIGAGLGAGAAYYYCKKKSCTTQKTILITAIGGLVGYIVGQQLEKRGILVKKSK